MTDKSMLSPEDQGATFVELFFDLVFVFAITQVTHYAAHHLEPHGILRSVLVFWLIWWGWTQFTWALNAADTDHHHVRVGTLVATGVAFVMAVSVDNAFASEPRVAIWFAVAYVTTRVLGLGLYYKIVSNQADRRSAVINFALLSVAGLAAVVGGSLVTPDIRDWIWVGAVMFDLSAAWVTGNSRSWGLHTGHFAERHGLIIIIALGESLIVAGSSLTAGVNGSLMVTGFLAVLLTCLLWWTYFGWVREVLEKAISDLEDRARAKLGRDAYSFWHFPLVSGIIALAVGFEASFHPEDYTTTQITLAVGTGLSLFLIATAGALQRARGCILWNRLVILAITLTAMGFSSSTTINQILAIACGGLAVVVAIEQVTIKKSLEAETC
jgi:low temperature requirement protein LtrA